MLLTSLAFLILFVAAKSGGDQTFVTDSRGQFVLDDHRELKAIQHHVSPLWLIAAYMVISLGELMLSPMGLSLVSKVAPARMRGLMMGGWFVATAIGNKLTVIGTLWTQWYHSSFWLLCSLSGAGDGLRLAAALASAQEGDARRLSAIPWTFHSSRNDIDATALLALLAHGDGGLALLGRRPADDDRRLAGREGSLRSPALARRRRCRLCGLRARPRHRQDDEQPLARSRRRAASPNS